MTQSEYESKRQEYMASSAPIEVREKAIAELDAKFNLPKAYLRAKQDEFEGRSELKAGELS